MKSESGGNLIWSVILLNRRNYKPRLNDLDNRLLIEQTTQTSILDKTLIVLRIRR